ncbi:ATP-dependent Clp protease adapter protein CLPS2, chloroplastic-like [Miscanthus floridulus]|uniref:ATP-dependent Clp protease adapter protein CLPS2, chloroplastic-like n=1 Tax=Miscanthus floridulus TaxID=154761 RepID=UPI003458B147
MAMAISGRAAALVVPSTAATTPLPSTVSVNQRAARLRNRKKATMKVATAPHASGGGGGGAVLERPPAFDQSQLDTLPVTQEGRDPGRLKDGRRSGSGDSYKVLLVDNVRYTEKHVEKALPQVVPSITDEAARQLFHESRMRGVATVIVAVKEHAEFYAQMMVRQGLRSAIEPESDMAT